jgi:hypothetical protein
LFLSFCFGEWWVSFSFFVSSVRRSLAMGSEANVHKLLQGAADQELHSGFKRICVFCGSSSGNKSVYIDVAMELGNELVSSSKILPSCSTLIILLGTAFSNLWTQHIKSMFEQNACSNNMCAKDGSAYGKYTILWTDLSNALQFWVIL